MPSEPRILIVDDNAFFRSMIKRVLNGMDGVSVVGTAPDGVSAIQSIESLKPSLITLDVEMPKMNGLETLRKMRERGISTPVIMVSALTTSGAQITLQALDNGALDFITKPSSSNLSENIKILRDKLAPFILPEQKAGLKAPKAPIASIAPPTKRGKHPADAIAIGISTGGPKALSRFLPALCQKVSLPIFIVQHMPPVFTAELSKNLNLSCKATVVEAEDEQIVSANSVYIAPGGFHMKVVSFGGEKKIKLTKDPEECFCRPAADYLFRSIASVYGRRSIGVVMTGIGKDGTLGVKEMKKMGARIIAQDEASSTVYGMPKSVVESGLADQVSSLKDMDQTISRLVG